MSIKSTWLLTVGYAVLLTAVAGNKQTSAAPKSVAWRSSFQAALQEAKRTRKPVMMDLWATWCSPCRAMDKRTFVHISVIEESRKWIPVKVDIDAQPEIAERYGLNSPPLLLFLRPDGSVISKVVGFTDATGVVKAMKVAYATSSPK